MAQWSALLDHYADESVTHDEQSNEQAVRLGKDQDRRDLPWLGSAERRQAEVARRKLRSIVELGEICNMLEVSWADENGDQKWFDEDGGETDLETEVEKLMPREELRGSGGRARQVAGFRKTIKAMRKVGVPDIKIFEAARPGHSSRLGILRHAQREIDKRTTDDDERRDLYEQSIEIAATARSVSKAKKDLAKLVDPDAPELAAIPYSCESTTEDDGALWWVAMLMTHDQFCDTFMRVLGDDIELSTVPLFGDLVKFWRGRYG